MSGLSWGGLLLAWVTAIAIPGPDIFLLLRLGVRERRAAVLAALGIMTGNLIWITVSVLGLTALFFTLPVLTPVLQLVGVGVLCLLGVSSVRTGLRQLRGHGENRNGATARRPWLLGLTVNLANPKALIFFSALLTQFLPAGADWVTRVQIILVMTLLGLTWFVAVALASSAQAFRIWFGRAAPSFDVVAGGLFIVIALVLLVEVLWGLTR